MLVTLTITHRPATNLGDFAAKMLATEACREWILGSDPAGVVVLVNRTTGEVVSHGQVHSGYPTSALPAMLPLPISLR